MIRGGFTVEFPLQGRHSAFSQAVTAAAKGLQVLFRSDRDFAHWVFTAPQLHRAFVTAPDDSAVIKLITKT